MKFNIVIPSIKYSKELNFTLKKLEDQSYKNFFVTIVLDKKNKKIPKYKFKLNVLVVGKKHMSFKRNLAVKKYRSEYVGFLDSDAYPPKKWLKNALNLLKRDNIDVVGGPSIPFPKQNLSEMISHYAKRSFFVTGNLNFRKYLAKDRFCDWLESCNFFILRKKYIKFGGMDESKFISEDFNFFSKVNKKNPKFKTFYSKQLFVYHKERNFLKFLVQRFSYGTAAFSLINFKNSSSKYQSLYPLFALIFFLTLFIFGLKNNNLLFLLIATITLIETIIIYEIKKYINNLATLFIVFILINLANLSFSLGSIFGLFLNVNKNLIKKIYISSRSNN